MERVGRQRKAFDEKQNEHIHLNKKPNAMLASLNYKSTTFDNPLKALPNLNNIASTNIHYYESLHIHSQRPSLNLTSRPQQFVKKPQLVRIQPISNSKSYTKVYGNDLSHYFRPFVKHSPEPFLTGHQVTSALRARMLDWMVQVIESYKFTNKTYFAGVQIMDRYFSQEMLVIPVQKLHIIGVVAMLVASKMEEVYPFRLKTIYEKIVHKKIPCRDLVEMELAIFEKLGFNTLTLTFYDQMLLQLYSYSLEQGVFESNPLKDDIVLQEVQTYCACIGKFASYNYEVVTYFNKQVLADAVLSLSLQVLNIKAQGVVGVSTNLIQVEECRNHIKGTIINFKKNFKGLNNMFKFSNQKVMARVDEHFK